MNKKIAAVVAAMALTVSMCACSKSDETTTSTTAKEETTTTTEEETTTSEEETTTSESEPQNTITPDTAGRDAVLGDLKSQGFTITENLDDVEFSCFKGQDGFTAVNGDEVFVFAQYDSDDKLQMLLDQGLPKDCSGTASMTSDGVSFFYTIQDEGEDFQYMVVNQDTRQALYYTGPEERGARVNAYAFEMELIPPMTAYAIFDEDPAYPNGKGLTNKTPAAPEVELKNQAAIDLMDKLTAEGFSISAFPIEGLHMDELAPDDSLGYMGGAGSDEGEYAYLSMIVYMENDDVDALKELAEAVLKDAKDDPSLADFEVTENDKIIAIAGEQMGMSMIVAWNLEDGYVLELMGQDLEASKDLAKELGFDF